VNTGSDTDLDGPTNGLQGAYEMDSKNTEPGMRSLRVFNGATTPLQRPPYPPEEIANRIGGFQFPKTLLWTATRPLAALSNRGWLFGDPPLAHVVMCGFPRSGTTLCQLMVQACVADIQCFPKEERAIAVARSAIKTKPYLFTKRPKDIWQIDDLRAFYANLPTKVKFLLFVRDPRAVLTSFHETRKGEYYVSIDRWRAIWEHWKWAIQFPDVLTVRFEELIQNSSQVQEAITQHIGWTVVRPFSEFHQAVPSGFDTRALNGVRPLDAKVLKSWSAPKHRERIQELLRQMPELPQRLIDLNYETDDRWIQEWEITSKAA
jgi:hypothetical protein